MGNTAKTRSPAAARKKHRSWWLGVVVVLLASVIVAWSTRTDVPNLAVRRADPNEAKAATRTPPPVSRQRHRTAEVERELVGHVTADGSAAEGARVCALCSTCDISLSPRGSCTSAAADGTFTLRAVPTTPFVVTAALDGYSVGLARAGKSIDMAGERHVDVGEIVLTAGGSRIAGHVFDATGGPIEGATVQVALADFSVRPLAELTTDSTGHFSGSVNSRGIVALRADASGYSPNMIHRKLPSQDATIVLAPGATISGKVLAEGTETPVGGVEVVAMGTMGATLVPPARSDDAGRFTLSGLPPGRYHLVGEGDNHRGSSPTMVNIGLSDSITDAVVYVTNGAMVTGKVLSKSGEEPCAEGYVAVGPWSPLTLASRLGEVAVEPEAQLPVPAIRAQIEPSGNVLLRGLTPGRYYVRLECRGRVYSSGPTVLDVAQEDLVVSWSVTEGAALRVVAQDEQGEPVPYAEVSLQLPARGHGGGTYQSLRIDESGQALLEGGLYPGRYVVLPAEGYGAAPVPVELGENDEMVTATVVLPGKSGLLVRVRDGRGTPLDSVQVVARRVNEEAESADGAIREEASAEPELLHPGTPQGDGSYAVRPLKAGAYTVEVQSDSNPPQSGANSAGKKVISLAPGQNETVEVTLDCSTPLNGTVVDDANAPLPDAWVTASFESDAEKDDSMAQAFARPPRRVLTDAAGSFTIEGLCSDATYRVQASLDRGGSGSVEKAVPGEAIQIVARWHGNIEGQVRTRQGTPVADCLLTVVHDATGRSREIRVHSTDGSFNLNDLPAGPSTLSVHGAGIAGQTSVVIPSAGTLRDAQVVVDQTATARGDGS